MKAASKRVPKTDLYRKLPSVNELVRSTPLAPLLAQEGQASIADAARTVLSHVRQEIASGLLDEEGVRLAVSHLAVAVACQVKESLSYSLRSVINATGVILHTNLGRAPLSRSALEHILETASEYSNLEFDIPSAERGHRDIHVDRLFRRLFDEDADAGSRPRPVSPERGSGWMAQGPILRQSALRREAVSTIVVNNNAAAVLLALNTLAEDGEVIVSRGELVEIGGSFRIPQIMSKSSAVLREVGATNRTYISDYEQAINDNTRLLLRVHRSNFQITGFTEQPRLDELVALARRRNLPLMEDLGSGSLFDLNSVGVKNEPGVLDSLQSGVDVVTYSGDKLLGGPQAGILTGRSELIAGMRDNPLFRALRVDKLTYAALEATLLAYVKHDHDAIPILRMMRWSKDEIGQRAAAIAAQIPAGRLSVELMDGESVIGGGAAPSATLPTRLLAVTSAAATADEVATRLCAADIPIIARVEEGRVLLDLRTVFPEQDAVLTKTFLRLATS